MTKLRAAPGVFGCCDPAGRLVSYARAWISEGDLVRLGCARGEGTREELEARIRDLIAAGQLIEFDEG